jgi:hypothetical protein
MLEVKVSPYKQANRIMGRLGTGIYAAVQADAEGSILSCYSVVLAENFRL